MRTRTILVIIDNLLAGGMQRQAVELLKGVKRRGLFRTVLGVLSRDSGIQGEAFRFADVVVHAERRWRFDPTPLFPLIASARREGVEIVHAIGWMSGLAGLAVARALKVPVINGSIRSAPPALPWHERITRWCAQHSDAIVANSEAGLVAYGVRADPRSSVILNGIDLSRFDHVVPASTSAACMVGNFGVYKDQMTVIRAFALVRKRHPSAVLTLVGKPLARNDHRSLEVSRALATELGLHDAVRFVTDANDASSWIAASAIGVLASSVTHHGEGISNAILEYMALSKPVVVTDSGGNREVVREGDTGFVVPGDNPEAMAQRISELLDNPAVAHKMGSCGRGVIESRFTLDQMCRRYEQLYDSLAPGVEDTL